MKVIVIGIAERKEREQAEMREEILNAAREIIADEGLEKVSIRKIAAKIEYSPAIIYHYFSSKDEIIEKLMSENYAKLVKALSVLQTADQPSTEKLRQSALRFITLAVQMGDTYKSLMLSSSPAILAHTSVLQQGAAKERSAIAMLCGALKEQPAMAGKDDSYIEQTAQIIWSTAFGLAIRILVEQVDKEQQKKLIQHAADFVLKALEK